MRVSERLLVAVAALGLLLCSLALSAQTLQVVGTDGKATTLSAAQITALPHVKASVQDHGATLEFEGVPLAKCSPPAGSSSATACAVHV